MKIGGMGMPELILILVVVLLIFGPKNLPKLGAAFGKTVKNLREGMNSSSDDANESEEDEYATSAVPENAAAAVEESDEGDVSPTPKKRVVKKSVA